MFPYFNEYRNILQESSRAIDSVAIQLGFILFFYGLAFILLGATCIAIARIGGRDEAWVVLGLFGFVHGAGEWLDLAAMVVSNSPAFALVLNARDAVAREDTITVSARNVRLIPGMTLDNLAGDFVAVAVADTDAGIAADVLPRVFEPFFTTKPGDKGTGLGLAQVHGFAQRSGGVVTIDSDVGKGTVVTLYLPRTDAPPRRAAPEPVTRSRAATRSWSRTIPRSPRRAATCSPISGLRCRSPMTRWARSR
jgi:hypothetical protein